VPLSLTSRVRASPDQVSCALDGDAAVLHLGSGLYFGLDPVGARVWELVQEPIAVTAVIDALEQEFEATRGQLEADVAAFLESLTSHGLLEVAG
jgi:hypothetical protein